MIDTPITIQCVARMAVIPTCAFLTTPASALDLNSFHAVQPNSGPARTILPGSKPHSLGG